ncbi:MAG: hypothetical protein ABIG63_00145 [Chloroflexota bacterium]
MNHLYDEDDIFDPARKYPASEVFKPTRYFTGCRHWREPVIVGRYIVTCSSCVTKSNLPPPTPDFGVYMAIGWRETLGRMWTNGSYLKRLAEARPYPALFVDWPDGGVIPVSQINTLVEICRSKMSRGKQVDLGCHAAHGRTGTLLACLIARVEHLNGRKALEAVRYRYCKWAVESSAQERAITEYAEKYAVRRKRK